MNDTDKTLMAKVDKSLLNSRALLLYAAADIFSKKGFKAASVREIAAEANVANPMIAYHFGSKENLWRAVIDWLSDHILETSNQIKADSEFLPSDQIFYTCLYNMLKYSDEKRALFRRIMALEIVSNSPLTQYVTEKLSGVMDNNLNFFKRAYDSGTATEISAREMHAVFVGFSTWWFTRPNEVERILQKKPEDPVNTEETAKTLFRLFTGRLYDG